ncbi:hypothetical protein ACH5RR_040908, partial [Cinchona calisaya]
MKGILKGNDITIFLLNDRTTLICLWAPPPQASTPFSSADAHPRPCHSLFSPRRPLNFSLHLFLFR